MANYSFKNTSARKGMEGLGDGLGKDSEGIRITALFFSLHPTEDQNSTRWIRKPFAPTVFDSAYWVHIATSYTQRSSSKAYEMVSYQENVIDKRDFNQGVWCYNSHRRLGRITPLPYTIWYFQLPPSGLRAAWYNAGSRRILRENDRPLLPRHLASNAKSKVWLHS